MQKEVRPSQDQQASQNDAARRTARSLALSMAGVAQQLAEKPWKTLWTTLEYRVLKSLSQAERIFPQRRRIKFARSAAKRAPSRFLEIVEQAPDVVAVAMPSSGKPVLRAEEFVTYDPTLQPPQTDIRLIAFYLPQFHPFEENDAWWGKGFTEWTNVGKALPLYDGHYQPHCPIHFGYYDLRVPEVMEEQARVARQYGIAGFAHHFYWFAGKTLMERPLRDMLANPKVDIPFCLSWANENWTPRWDGKDSDILIGQSYSEADARAMIRHVAEYFRDPRYIRIEGKPVFLVYRPMVIPDVVKMQAFWRDEARAAGIGEIYLVGAQTANGESPDSWGFDASVEFPPHGLWTLNFAMSYRPYSADFGGQIYDYSEIVANALAVDGKEYKMFRGVTMSWDNTARRPNMATICENFSISDYRRWLAELCRRLRADPKIIPDEKLIFINAWNEWAEGTHLEPDQRYGFAYLSATRDAFTADQSDPNRS